MILLIITDVMIKHVTISLLIVALTSHDNANENDKDYHLSYSRVIVSLATLAPLPTITRTIFIWQDFILVSQGDFNRMLKHLKSV